MGKPLKKIFRKKSLDKKRRKNWTQNVFSKKINSIVLILDVKNGRNNFQFPKLNEFINFEFTVNFGFIIFTVNLKFEINIIIFVS